MIKTNKDIHFYHVVQPIINLLIMKFMDMRFYSDRNPIKIQRSFLKQAKEQNKLIDLDMKSIFKALETYKKWLADLGNLSIYINVFPSTLIDPVFNYNLKRILSEMDLIPSS